MSGTGLVTVDIPYRDGFFPLKLPDDAELVEPNALDGALAGLGGLAALKGTGDSARDLVAAQVAKPIDAAPFDEFLQGATDLLVIVNDGTRPTPTSVVLDCIGDALESHNAHFLVATGAHRAPTEEEYRRIFGDKYIRFRGKTEAHNAKDAASLVSFGQTRSGTPVLLNKRVAEADRIIVIGSVEPHYFAGYTGGRKAFLPGVAGYATIEANHKLALDARAQSLALAENPVNQDMQDALKRIEVPVFAIMTVLNSEQELAVCTAGDIEASFAHAVEAANAIFAVKMRERADLVISVAREPMDINLYQAQKAIDNGAMAVADGGILVLVASCWDGVGDKAYMDLLGAASSPHEALEKIDAGYKLGYHKAAKIAQVAERIRLLAYSELSGSTLRQAFIGKIDTVAALQEMVDIEVAKGAHVAVLMDGTLTVPIVRENYSITEGH